MDNSVEKKQEQMKNKNTQPNECPEKGQRRKLPGSGRFTAIQNRSAEPDRQPSSIQPLVIFSEEFFQ